MATKIIADHFPKDWSYGHYEIDIHQSLYDQINLCWPHCDNLLFSTTWMGPQTQQQIYELAQSGAKFNNLIITSTVDAALAFEVYPLIDQLVKTFEVQQVLKVGNFDGNYEFNIFAIACLNNFKPYADDDLLLKKVKWRYCCYNRKPYPHRVDLVRQLVQKHLDSHGVITLGRPFPGQPDHGLYRSIGERSEDYEQWGHWYGSGTVATPHEIPHDLYSLHNWDVWQHHFLHIVGSTSSGDLDDTFVNQINFKPLIGMRPFVINGQIKQYKWLHRNGFRTFNHYWPEINVEQSYIHNNRLANAIVDVIKLLISKSDNEIIDMYNHMLPDLIHNRQRWFEWATEQKHRANNLFQ